MSGMDCYETLGLERDSLQEEIHERYLQLAGLLTGDSVTPELGPWATRQLALVEEAYGVLGDPARRRDYDSRGRTGAAEASASGRPVEAPTASGGGSRGAAAVSRPRGAPWTRGPLPMAIGGGFLGVAILLAAAAGTGNWDRVTGLFDRSTPSNAAQIALVDEQRVTALEMAVQLDPANVQALFELGEIYVQAEAWSDVIHWHNRVLEVDPTNTHSLNDVALASVYLGRYEEGLAYWDRALELEPNNPVLHYSLAFSLLNSPPYDWIRAREHFQRVIDLDPQSESAQSARSHVQAINSSLDAGDLEAEGATP